MLEPKIVTNMSTLMTQSDNYWNTVALMIWESVKSEAFLKYSTFF